MRDEILFKERNIGSSRKRRYLQKEDDLVAYICLKEPHSKKVGEALQTFPQNIRKFELPPNSPVC